MRMPMRLLLAGCALGALALTALCWPRPAATAAPAPAGSLASPSPLAGDPLTSDRRGEGRVAGAAPARTPLAADTAAGTATDPATSPDAQGEVMVVHVVDARGRSVPEAAVLRVDQPAPERGVLRFTADGTFELNQMMTALPGGRQGFVVQLGPSQSLTWGVGVQADGVNSGSISLRVQGTESDDDGRPPRLHPLGVTDASGRCRVDAAYGVALVATTDGGWSSGLVDSVEGSVHTDGEVVLVVLPPCLVRGLVVDAGGQALAGGTVAARASGRRGAARGRSLADVATDDAGGFVLALDAVATFELTAQLGELKSETLLVDARAARSESVRIRMLEAIEVRGDVRDPQGALRAEASVRVRRADADPSADRLAKPFDATVTTDAEGNFHLLVPGPGHYVATASHDEHAPSAPTPIAVGAAHGEDVTHLLLRTWATMSGSVRWDDGSPVARAQLTARPEPGADADDTEPRSTETGNDGSFAFTNLPGHLRYELTCVPDPALPHTRVVRPGLWPSVQHFVLEEKTLRGASVRIRLTVPDAARYESGSVLVSRRLPTGWARGADRDLAFDFDGSPFGTLDGLAPGETYAVELRGQYSRCRTEPFVAGVDAERTLILKHPGAVTVLVREADGTPAFGATAILREDAPVGLRRDDATKQTDLHGRARWDSVSALPWFILAARDGQEGQPIHLQVEPGRDHEIEVRLR